MPRKKSTKKEPEDPIEKLEKTIKRVEKRLKRAVSFKFLFLRGIVVGVGTAIGATIIAAIVIGILATIVNTLDKVPVIDQIIERTGIHEAMESVKIK